MARWTDDDFRVVFNFLQDIRAALDDPRILEECRELLKSEAGEANRRLANISDAVGAFGAGAV